MKKIVSFSLWGDNPKYTVGAIENANLMSVIYPGWVARFYCGKTVPTDIINKLKNISNVEVINMEDDGDWTGMFWRFMACEDSDVMLSRDTDSRISIREKEAVYEWLDSDKDFHIMRDHPYHNTKILGGMWGCRNGLLNNMSDLISKFKMGNYWQVDQIFLKDYIYDIIKNNVIVHDSYFNFENNRLPFPSERNDKEFVGDVFDENNVRHPEYFKFL